MYINFSALLMGVFAVSVVSFPTSAHLAEVQKGPVKRDKLWYKDSAGAGPVQLIVSIPDQKMNVYRNGQHIIETRVSSGKAGHNTPSGVFSILEKRKRHFSNLYDNAPMPFMQRLTWSGVALHAGNVSRRFASHGCIRLPYNFAQKLFGYTRRGAHVVVTNEKVSPQQIMHQNLIAPIPRLVPVTDKVSKSRLRLSTPAHAATRTVTQNGRDIEYKLVPTEAEARLDRLNSHKVKTKKDLVSAKALMKTQRAESSARWQVYSKRKSKAAGLAYKHSKLMKQISWAENRVEHAIKASAIKTRKTQDWQQVAEERQVKYQQQLSDLDAEVKALNEMQVSANVTAKEAKKIRKKLSTLKWKRVRLMKSVKWADNSAMNARKSVEAQKKAAASWIEAQENKLESLQKKLADLNVEYLPLKKMRDEAKVSYEEIQAQTKDTAGKIQKLQRDLYRTGGEIKQAKRLIRLQKKPLRIMLTRSKKSHNIKDIQQSLSDLGYEIEKIDGIFGSETRAVIKKYQKDNSLKISGVIDNDLVNSMRKKLGREPLKNGHIYVRQGFVDIYNAPVTIAKPEKLLGTHFYSVMDFDKTDNEARWTAVTIKSRKQLAKKKKKKVKVDPLVTASVQNDNGVASTAKEALDRITLPEQVQHFLSRRLTPGSSLVIADKGRSHETGEGTDFIVLAR